MMYTILTHSGRVKASKLLDMVDALQIPDQNTTHGTKSVFIVVEALGLTLAQFRSAGDQYELSMLYNQSQSSIFEIVNQVVTIVDESWKHLLEFDHAHL